MDLVALKNLSNGIKAGQTFTERDPKAVEILITIGAARAVDQEPPRLRRRGRPLRSSSTEATSA